MQVIYLLHKWGVLGSPSRFEPQGNDIVGVLEGIEESSFNEW